MNISFIITIETRHK